MAKTLTQRKPKKWLFRTTSWISFTTEDKTKSFCFYIKLTEWYYRIWWKLPWPIHFSLNFELILFMKSINPKIERRMDNPHHNLWIIPYFTQKHLSTWYCSKLVITVWVLPTSAIHESYSQRNQVKVQPNSLDCIWAAD